MTPAVRPASGRPLPPVGAGRTTGAHRDRFPWRRPVGGGHGTRRVDAIWHEGRAELGRRQRGHASCLGRLGDGGDGVLSAAGDSRYIDPDEPAAHGWMVAVRAEGPGSATLVPLMAVESGRSVLRAANQDRPGAAPPVSQASLSCPVRKLPLHQYVEGSSLRSVTTSVRSQGKYTRREVSAGLRKFRNRRTRGLVAHKGGCWLG